MSTSPMDHDHHQRLQKSARDHLWLHFSRMGAYKDHDMPIITAHMTACSPAPTAGTSRRRRPRGNSSRPAAARYHAPRPANKADSTQRETSFPITVHPSGKGIAYLTATIINATILCGQVVSGENKPIPGMPYTR